MPVAKGRGRARGRIPTNLSPGPSPPKERRLGGKPQLDPLPLTELENPFREQSPSKGPPSPSADSGIHEMNRESPPCAPSPNFSEISDDIPAVLAKKPGYAKEGRPITVWANLFEIQITNNEKIFRYHVDVDQIFHRERKEIVKNLTKGSSNEYFRIKKQELCYAVLREVVIENRDYFDGKIYGIVYDRRNTLYTKEPLCTNKEGKDEFDVVLQHKDLKPEERQFRLTLTLTDQDPIDLSDLSGVTTRDMDSFDRSTQQLVEVITSQIIFDNPQYTSAGSKFFRKGRDLKDVGMGRELGDGFVKSSKPIEGINGKGPTMALIADNKKTAFFKAQPALDTLLDTLKSMGGRNQQVNRVPPFLKDFQRDEFAHSVRDLAMRNDRTGREFIVYKLTGRDSEGRTVKENANTVRKKFEDKKRKMFRDISIAKFYEEQHKVHLKFPELPMFAEKPPKGDLLYHPIECCSVLPNQSVPIAKQTPEQMQQMIRESALKPLDNLNQLDGKMRELKLMDSRSNAYLAEMGIQIKAKPIEIQGRVREAPIINYYKKVLKPDPKGNWDMRDASFFKVGQCKKWASVKMDERANNQSLTQFLNMFYTEARRLKLHMEPCALQETFLPGNNMEAFFKYLAGQGVDFLFCFIPSRGNEVKSLKDDMKFYEQQYGILTQCVKSQTANDIASGYRGNAARTRTTLFNVLLKTNMKLGGLNYDITLNNKKRFSELIAGERTMFLGLDVSHPPPQPARLRHLPPREPSVVGFVCNTPKRPMMFTGELALQNPREEMVESMQSLMDKMIGRWVKQSEGGKLPEKVFYYRDGVSEGQFSKVIREEIEPIKSAFELKLNGQPMPKFTVIVCIKRHHERLFRPGPELEKMRNAPATAQDLPVGTVVDKGIIHENRWELFMKPHLALQGTAKPLKITVLLDENNLSEDDVEDLSFALCHGHQIVNKSVSLPSPVFGAHEMAERGKRLYRAWNQKQIDEGRSVGGDSADSGMAEGVERDWAAITQQLQVTGTILENRKHWA